MKTLILTLLAFLIVEHICVAQRHEVINKSNHNTKNVSLSTQDELLRISSNISHIAALNKSAINNFQKNLRYRIDSLDIHHKVFPLANEKLLIEGLDNKTIFPKKVQSQIFVIDTAIVRRLGENGELGDTTRHLYLYNTQAKIISDLTQKKVGQMWLDTMRTTYTYDSNNNLVVYLKENWFNNQWIVSYRSTSTYDDQGNLLIFLKEEFQNGQQINGYRITYTFDLHGNKLTSLDENWSGQWVNYSRQTNTFNEQGKVLSELLEYWENNSWILRFSSEYTYDEQLNISTYLEEYWLNGQLESSWIENYTYDLQGNLLTVLHKYWWYGQWVTQYRVTFTYDAQGNKLTYLLESWDGNQWMNAMRELFTYNAQGKLLTFLQQFWDYTYWRNYNRFISTYDTQGNMLTHLQEYWDNGQWVIEYKTTYTYNAQGKVLTRTNEYWSYGQVSITNNFYTYNQQGSMLTHIEEFWQYGQLDYRHLENYNYDAYEYLISFLKQNWLDNNWMPINVPFYGFTISDSVGNSFNFLGYNFIFSYKPLKLVDVLPENEKMVSNFYLLQNYPNPFNPSTKIIWQTPIGSHQTLKIFDILGNEIATLVNEYKPAGKYEVTFDSHSGVVRNLPSGVYFYKLQAGDFAETKKMILLK